MKRLFLFIPLVVFIALGALFWKGLTLDPTELPTALLNKPVPAFSLPALAAEDGLLTQESLKGKPALLNVWATWCPTCKEEHAQLNKIAREEGVTIYGINYKDERAAANDWLARYSNPYVLNIYDEAGSLGLDLGVYGAPETYVLDSNGIIRYRHVGAVDQAVWEQLRSIMKQVSEPSQQEGAG
ncbi:DsbE family thiol:disulfide interchange protein [Neptunomonas phycophila]|uniref:DsbE family thiol:disulfide interchange protein n=1 Tax=Neptunomonas phycophila TaxID=1572645 RepID=UPI0026E37286|nr:DsbE family thiol:disulfide interchange protein [Neptunomonas phycophila]MDO6782486.1 DsbE family thiol:disulfide interchange protein [Neptunomonas phycophila]